MIDVYKGKRGLVGIDACVAPTLAAEMLAAMMHGAALEIYACQEREGGMVGIDAQVSASVAARVLTKAELAGVQIRR
jgi:hypothetical protein